MKSVIKSFTGVAGLLVCATQLQAADYGTFESFYSAGGLGFWGWTAIIAGTVAVAALTFFTFGGGAAAIPGWMATVGAWIGSTVGLSGVAATNFGLALLGGGSVAAGGLGIAGGVAVLTAAMRFGIDAGIYSTEVALEKWNQKKFVEANREMLTLPLPRNEKGGSAYRTALEFLQENIKPNLSLSTPENQDVLRRTSELLQKKMLEEEDLDYVLKDKTFLAMLNLQMNRYGTATDVAAQAISLADNIREERTLPSYIWALSILADPDRECTSDVIEALRVAYCHEPDNILIPIMTGSCMDRLMYRYHYGRLSIDQLSLFYRVITDSRLDEELSAASLEIFVTRCLIELKRTKQDIFIVTRDSDMMANPEVVQELKRRFDRHKSLITLLLMVFPEIERLADEFPKDSRIESAHLTELLNSYYQDLEMLEKQIRHVPR